MMQHKTYLLLQRAIYPMRQTITIFFLIMNSNFLHFFICSFEVVVANSAIHNLDVWRPLPNWLGDEQPYDLNSWQESETALALADTLDEDAVIVEGYAEYATWRPHLAYLRDPYGDPDVEMDIDGVGGVSILAKARVFRAGVHFPAFSFEKHAETEGFGKVCQLSPISLYSGWRSNADNYIDGKKNEIFCCGSSPLHHLAFV